MPTSFHKHFGYSEIRFIAFISLMCEDLENGSNFYQPRTHLRHTPLLTIMSQCMTLENYFLQIAVLSRSIITTRMHSSRMRTARLLTCAGGSAFGPLGVCFWSQGGSAFGPRGGLPLVLGVSAFGSGVGGIPACTEADTPPENRILDTRY